MEGKSTTMEPAAMTRRGPRRIGPNRGGSDETLTLGSTREEWGFGEVEGRRGRRGLGSKCRGGVGLRSCGRGWFLKTGEAGGVTLTNGATWSVSVREIFFFIRIQIGLDWIGLELVLWSSLKII